MAAASVVAPAVPTVAITAVSSVRAGIDQNRLAGGEIRTLATLILLAPAADAADSVVAGCTRKSVQLLSVSAPSGKRPRLRARRPPAAAAGTTTMQPPLP